MTQVEEAYAHLHDLDWLRDCPLARLPEVRQRMNPRHILPQAQSLRELLIQAAQQVIQVTGTVPDKSGVKVFLEGYIAGKTVTDIARELGVSREWASRGYRKEALGMAGAQFVRLVSRDEPTPR